MFIADITNFLETIAPPAYQESYDNCGLLTGNKNAECKGAICTLDVTEEVIEEAIAANCNLIIAHHPVIFKGLKKITGSNAVEKIIIKAIKNDIAIYAIHTNLDNVHTGVNKKTADRLGLTDLKILAPKSDMLCKMYVMVPQPHADKVRQAMFDAGAGQISEYSECSFNITGTGTFMPGKNASPKIGENNVRNSIEEVKIEVLFPFYLKNKIIAAAKSAHIYEEMAYDIIHLANENQNVGSGMIGILPEAISEKDFLRNIKQSFDLQLIKHTSLLEKHVKKVAVCGGAGSFLLKNAIAAGADFYITSDMKYHEFFDAERKIVVADIGHYESEQFTSDLLVEVLNANFPNFAARKTQVNTNPVKYFL